MSLQKTDQEQGVADLQLLLEQTMAMHRLAAPQADDR
jgi:hypothetical protein